MNVRSYLEIKTFVPDWEKFTETELVVIGYFLVVVSIIVVVLNLFVETKPKLLVSFGSITGNVADSAVLLLSCELEKLSELSSEFSLESSSIGKVLLDVRVEVNDDVEEIAGSDVVTTTLDDVCEFDEDTVVDTVTGGKVFDSELLL